MGRWPIPEVRGGGGDVPGQFGGLDANRGRGGGASGYLVAWKNGASDEYTVWNTDTEGNYVGSAIEHGRATTGLISGDQDSNRTSIRDGTEIGPTTTTIEAFGLTGAWMRARGQVEDSARERSGPSLKFEGAAVGVGTVRRLDADRGRGGGERVPGGVEERQHQMSTRCGTPIPKAITWGARHRGSLGLRLRT